MLFGLIECRIAACTKRPSGPTGRTCYSTPDKLIPGNALTLPIFSACARDVRVCLTCLRSGIRAHNFQTSIRRQWERSGPRRERRRKRERREETARDASPCECDARTRSPMNLNLFALVVIVKDNVVRTCIKHLTMPIKILNIVKKKKNIYKTCQKSSKTTANTEPHNQSLQFLKVRGSVNSCTGVLDGARRFYVTTAVIYADAPSAPANYRYLRCGFLVHTAIGETGSCDSGDESASKRRHAKRARTSGPIPGPGARRHGRR